MKILNIGCGHRFHPDMVNIDMRPAHPSVRQCDITRAVPFADGSFDAVYHSHVLEHIEKKRAAVFISECYRLIKPGGVIRVAVPDLEQIARLYLHALERAVEDDRKWQDRYEWLMLELYDQAVRTRSGGEMKTYLGREALPERSFIVERGGSEIRQLMGAIGRRHLSEMERKARKRPKFKGVALKERILRRMLGDEYRFLEVGRFRCSGEVHQWMYDRWSLSRLLDQCGFTEIGARSAGESTIPEWASYHLDTEPNGDVYKPESLYMEAVRPQT